MTITTDRTKVVMATRLNAKEKQGERLMLIKFSCYSDQQEAEAGTPVVIKSEWKDPE